MRDITIPMWRNPFAIQLSLADQRNAVELANAIDDTSNELMRKNAELVHATAVGSARGRRRSACVSCGGDAGIEERIIRGVSTRLPHITLPLMS